MDAIIANNTVPLAQADTAPSSGTPQYATNGNPAAQIPATRFPAYHYNGLIQEILAVIRAGNLTPDRTNLGQLLAAIEALIGIQAPMTNLTVFGGSGNFIVPASNVSVLYVHLVGGGGGGGGGAPGLSGAGGGAGGYAEGRIVVTPGQVLPVVIGAGGAGGAGATTGGTAGGTTSIGGFSATGGQGAGLTASNGAYFASGGQGGVGSGSGLTMPGGCGSDGQAGQGSVSSGGTYPMQFAGNGGASHFGGGGRAAAGQNYPVQNGAAFGSGGGGLYNASGSGGNGAPGLVIVRC